MKISLIALTFFIVMLSGCASSGYVAQAPAYQDVVEPEQVTYQSFYDNLSPYGNWIDYPQYGHVWNPRVSGNFRPYASNGQWRYSNDGWAWQSNYNWGWAPFHYGSWLYDDNYGWLWVPGYDWSPAWVTWGRVDNNYAWAPLMPDVNIGSEYNNWRPHASYWNIVPREHVGDRNLTSVMVYYDRNNNRNGNYDYENSMNRGNPNVINNNTVINNNNSTKNITIINNYNTSRTNNYYAKGPDVGEVEKYTHNVIRPVTFRDVRQISKVPGSSSNVMDVYRPVVQSRGGTGNGLQQEAANNNGQNRPTDPPINKMQGGNNPNKKQGNSTNSTLTPRELSTPVPVQNNHPVMDQSGNTNLQEANHNGNVNVPEKNNQQPIRQYKPIQNGAPNAVTNPVPAQQNPATINQNSVQQQQQQQVQQQQQHDLLQQQRLQIQQDQQRDLLQQQRQLQQQQQQQQKIQQQRQQQQEQQGQNMQRNQNRNDQLDNQNQAQPRVYRRVEANQVRPIVNEAQTPVMQPRQQQRNVQQLPIQRPEQNESNRKPNRERDIR